MNCKPGDVAQVVRAADGQPDECDIALLGAIVRVTHLAADDIFCPLKRWEYAGARMSCRNCGLAIDVIPDIMLKPLPPEREVGIFDRDNAEPIEALERRLAEINREIDAINGVRR